MNLEQFRKLAAQAREMPIEIAESEYRELRDRLRGDYQHIAGRAADNRTREIRRLRGRDRSEKADRLEEYFERDCADYYRSADWKSVLAVRTGRLEGLGVGAVWFMGQELVEKTADEAWPRKQPAAKVA